MNPEYLNILRKPDLNEPSMITGFGGWPNAAGVSVEVINHLRNILGAQKIGEVEPEEFYIFTSVSPLTSRPITSVRNGVVDEFFFPQNEIFSYHDDDKECDLLLLLGMEPDLKWKTYTDTLFDFASDHGVKRIYTVGGYYDNVPHTREPKVSAVVNDSVLKNRLKGTGVTFTDYEGPTSIQSYLLIESRKYNMECIGLWGSVPYYIKVNYPKAYHKVLGILGQLLGIDLNISYLNDAALKLDMELADKIKKDPKLSDYVKRLERAYEMLEESSANMDSGNIVDDIQDFLKNEWHKEEDDDEE